MPDRIEHFPDCVLYLGDCRDILPSLEKADALITDPPYGTGWVMGGGTQAGDFKASATRPDWDEWNLDWLTLVQADVFAVFCPDTRIGDLQQAAGDTRLRYYIKSNPRPPLGGRDAPSVEPIVIWPGVRYSRGPAHMGAYNGDAVHPCQKPLAIMAWLVRDLTQSGDMVIDPFMGSGTTGIACSNLDRRFVGVEKDLKYFDIACRRIETAATAPKLLERPAKTRPVNFFPP